MGGKGRRERAKTDVIPVLVEHYRIVGEMHIGQIVTEVCKYNPWEVLGGPMTRCCEYV